MSFSTKIEQFSGDITGLDTTNALKQAVDHTLGVVKAANPALLASFARKMKVATSMGTGYNLRDTNVFSVLKMERETDSGTNSAKTYVCQPVGGEQEPSLIDSSSIYYAQAYSPSYIIDFESNLKIFPDPTSSHNGYMYLVYGSGSKTIDDTNETIKDNSETVFGDTFTTAERFPSVWKQYVILQASDILLQEKLSDFSGKISNVTDAIEKAQKLIDDSENVGGDSASTMSSAQDWLEDEDEDMTASTVQVAGQEINRATAELNKLNGDYQFVSNQLNLIQTKKQEFLQSQGLGGVSDNPVEGQI